MEEKVIVEILLLFLCILGIVPIIIFFMRKNDTGIDYYRIINEWNEMEEQNLETLALGNKEIDNIEKKILECKKELKIRLFRK
ncbi:MAG: hypothetical protein IJA94_04150 [Bacilli bacterium]|nr:hypothetical protein [Bacilli bacterium]